MLPREQAYQNDPFRRFDRLWCLAQFKTAAKLMDRYFDIYFYGNFPRHGKSVFNDHNERVRSLVPPKILLEFHPKDGWGPLCEFLPKDILAYEFPKINETAAWKAAFRTGQLCKKSRLLASV